MDFISLTSSKVSGWIVVRLYANRPLTDLNSQLFTITDMA